MRPDVPGIKPVVGWAASQGFRQWVIEKVLPDAIKPPAPELAGTDMPQTFPTTVEGWVSLFGSCVNQLLCTSAESLLGCGTLPVRGREPPVAATLPGG